MENNDAILGVFKEFLDSGMKGLQLEGIDDFLQAVADENDIPVLIVKRRNIYYILRKENNALG